MKRRMRFVTWAKKDPNDSRPIHYTFKGSDGTQHFTSEDVVSFSTMERIRNAWVEKIELIDGVWNAVIYED